MILLLAPQPHTRFRFDWFHTILLDACQLLHLSLFQLGLLFLRLGRSRSQGRENLSVRILLSIGSSSGVGRIEKHL